MNSRTTRRFRDLFAALPAQIRQQARDAYQLFRQNSAHPGLHFKQVHADPPIYSARVGIGYRVVGHTTAIRLSGSGSGRTPIMISSSSSSERRLRWRWVAWRTGPIVILLAALAAMAGAGAVDSVLPPAAGPASDRVVPPRLARRLRGDAVDGIAGGPSAWRCMCFGGVGGGCGGRSRRGSGCSARRA